MIVAIMIIGVVQMLIAGNGIFTDGVNTSLDAISYLNNLFNTLNTDGNDLQTYGTNLYNDLNSAAKAGCSQAKNLTAFYPSYQSYVNEYLDYVSPVPDKLSRVHDNLDRWGNEYREISVWVIYAVTIMIVLCYAISIYNKSKLSLQLFFGLTELVLILSFILIGVIMAITVSLYTMLFDVI